MSDHRVFSTPFGSWLCPVGYANRDAEQVVEELMAQSSSIYLLDVRLQARSRWYPAWNKGPLKEKWGQRYIHERCLGNLNYQYPDRPITLANPESAAEWVVSWLQHGCSFVVLCACKNYDRCHRKTVIEYLLQYCQAVNMGGTPDHA